MGTVDPTILTANTWTKVLSNVTTTGKVVIIDVDPEPTKYLVTIVSPVGADPPAADYDGGIVFEKSFNINNAPGAVDVYAMAVKHNGKVVIFT